MEDAGRREERGIGDENENKVKLRKNRETEREVEIKREEKAVKKN